MKKDKLKKILLVTTGVIILQSTPLKASEVDENLIIEDESKNEKLIARVTASNLNFRKLPKIENNIIRKLQINESGEVLDESGDWYKILVSGVEGYVHKDFVNTMLESEESILKLSLSKRDKGKEIVDNALTFIGVKYVYGGTNLETGVDCSGFVQTIYRNFDIKLNRVASAQYMQGISINKSDLKPGDLIFFRYYNSSEVSHIGIYIGDNKMVHASSSRGQVVVSDINSKYYIDNYVGSKRVI